MTITSVDQWSETADSNTDIAGFDIGENCSPAGINNAIRNLMAQVAATPLATFMGEFDTVSLLIADTARTYSNTTAGDYIRTRAEGFSYLVAASGASDHHVTTGGGLKLYVQAGPNGWNVRAFGAKGDDSTADLAALQKAFDRNGYIYIPNGIYRTNGPILLDDNIVVRFESQDAEIKSTSASFIFKGRDPTVTRNFFLQMYGGTLRGNGSCGGLDFLSFSDAKVFGTWITACNEAVKNGGSGSLGAFYNEFHGVTITTCTVGYRNGTLGNEIKVYGGRITDVVVATDDDDNSGVLYSGVAIETFTAAGHRMANSGSACVSVRSIGCRFENPSGGTYASAYGVNIAANAQDTSIISPSFINLAVNYADAGTRTQILFASNANQFAGGTVFKTIKRVTVNQAVASLAAGAIRQDAFSVPGLAAGDSITVTLPPSWPGALIAGPCIVASGTAYIPIYNPTGASSSLAADNFVFNWTDYT